MKRLVWLNDIHLDFAHEVIIEDFCEEITEAHPDGVLIGGDIAEAPSLEKHLSYLVKTLECPIYFVLGNHDYYQDSISGVRNLVMDISKNHPNLNWLPSQGVVELTKKTGLIGHGSWSDGRLGDYQNSEVILNDYWLIEEFKELTKAQRLKLLNQLGDRSADYFKIALEKAIKRYKNVLLLTHVPPFKEACFYGNSISDDNYLPHFSCRTVGERLTTIMAKNPDNNLLVLCGHTHGGGEVKILPNLEVRTGPARYGNPQIQQVLNIE